jgi:hypothetical protein
MGAWNLYLFSIASRRDVRVVFECSSLGSFLESSLC